MYIEKWQIIFFVLSLLYFIIRLEIEIRKNKKTGS
jgi:hypothetical protein